MRAALPQLSLMNGFGLHGILHVFLLSLNMIQKIIHRLDIVKSMPNWHFEGALEANVSTKPAFFSTYQTIY